MKKIHFFYLIGCLLFLNGMTFSSCSEDTPVQEEGQEETDKDSENDSDNDSENTPEENPNGNPDENTDKDPGTDPEGEETDSIPGLSDEMMQKIHAIYDEANIGPQEVRTVNQLAILTSYCASAEVAGPITVTPASLNEKDITLVTLGGTEEKEGQATTMKESQLASFGKPNDYLSAVTKLFRDGTIPKEKPVLVTGISLGGMIAQQLLADTLITRDHELCGIITFGSPITLPLDRRDVKIVRFADTHDEVPRLGEVVLRTGLATPKISKQELREILDRLDTKEKISRTSQYTDMIETHALSYIDEPCWNDTDFFGDSERKNLLILQDTLHFYPAPKQKSSEK